MADPLPPSITFVLLAAGSGSRFGGGKLLAPLAGQPLWHHAADAAARAGFATRIMVTRDDGPAAPDGWQRIVNAAPDEGIASSIRAGVAAAGGADRIVLALADMPFVDPAHLRALALADGTVFTAQPDGGRGIPAGFGRAAFAVLSSLTGDRGAGGAAWRDAKVLSADPGSLRDIDTPADLGAADLQRAQK